MATKSSQNTTRPSTASSATVVPPDHSWPPAAILLQSATLYHQAVLHPHSVGPLPTLRGRALSTTCERSKRLTFLHVPNLMCFFNHLAQEVTCPKTDPRRPTHQRCPRRQSVHPRPTVSGDCSAIRSNDNPVCGVEVVGQ